MNEEIKRLLEEIKSNKPMLFSMLSKTLKKEAEREARKQKTKQEYQGEHGPTHVYATMVKHIKCAHCGHKWERTYRLMKGETLSWCEGGRAKQAMVTRVIEDPIHICADVMNCHMCGRFVAEMDRDELETRYMSMLHTTSMERLSQMGRR